MADDLRAVSERVPYQELTEAERDAIHAWCELHKIRLRTTPVDPLIEFDRETNEWRVEQYHLRDGRPYLDNTGQDVVTIILRRQWRAWLPWRTA